MAEQADGFLLWGAGGHGGVVADLVASLGFRLTCVADLAPDAVRSFHAGHSPPRVISEADLLRELERARVVPHAEHVALGIGDNALRLQALARLSGASAPTLVHPRATVAALVTIGRGTVVFAGAVINVGARIGDAVIVNTSAVIEHDCVVEEGAHISPGAVLAGAVTVGSGSWVGAGAVVLPNVCIGRRVMIGAGAVVLRDVPDGVTAAGNPARIIGDSA